MANEDKKDFNAMLHKDAGMPKIQIITDEASIQKYGGNRMYFAPPHAYDRIMKTIPYGKVVTVGEIRAYLARTNVPISLTPSRRAFLYLSPHGPAFNALGTKHPTGGR